MKKIVLIFVAVMIMAFSSVCMAADGGDLNKDQKLLKHLSVVLQQKKFHMIN